MNKNTWLLVLLVSILLVIDSAFILIVQLGKADDISLNERFIQSATGNTQLDLFSRKVIDKTIPTKKDTTSTSVSRTKPKPTASSPNVVEVTGTNGFKMLVNYDKKTITVDGREIPWIIDPVVGTDGRPIAQQPTTASPTSWTYLNFSRFDIYVDSVYYASNQVALDQFFANFSERYALLEAETGWSSEKFYGTKLKINVTGIPGVCSGGEAYPGEAHVMLNDPVWPESSPCQRSGGIGELGNDWIYMTGMLDESQHAIGPFPIFFRSWLTQGFSQYLKYNVLVESGDISQTTADGNIYQGTSTYNWLGYVTNNYHDTTSNNYEIQYSNGYDITAWMYTMMRTNHGLDFSDFYNILNNNLETLNKADSYWATDLGFIYTDITVIDIFGKAVGHTDFQTQTKPIWRYDGPSGPGWGVRLMDENTTLGFTWYADLSPVLTVSDSTPIANETITLNATISNLGEVNLNNVSVRFYDNSNLINEQFVSVPANPNVVVQTQLTVSAGSHSIQVFVDEDNIKIESNDSNNFDTESVVASLPICGDTNLNGVITSADIIYLVNYVFKGGSAPLPYWQTGDVNANSAVTSADIIYLVGYVFKGGSPPLNQPTICSAPSGAATAGEYSYDEVIKYFNDAVASVSA
jgi:hypothetical protein